MCLYARESRVARELENFEANPPWGITCRLQEENDYSLLIANMLGPRDTPYEKGTFKIVVMVPERYPFEPPLMKFATPVYHPNIDHVGRICMDMIRMLPKGGWLPTYTLETLLVSLQTLLANPNVDDPLMMDIAHEYKNYPEEFQRAARAHTEMYAANV